MIFKIVKYLKFKYSKIKGKKIFIDDSFIVSCINCGGPTVNKINKNDIYCNRCDHIVLFTYNNFQIGKSWYDLN